MTTLQQGEEITVETNSLVETSEEQPLKEYTPPSRAEIILDLVKLREYLKQVRENVRTGKQRHSKKLSTELYINQLIMQANKIILYAYKETNINVTNNTNVDISNQVNELIKISREIGKCKQQKSQPSATN